MIIKIAFNIIHYNGIADNKKIRSKTGFMVVD